MLIAFFIKITTLTIRYHCFYIAVMLCSPLPLKFVGSKQKFDKNKLLSEHLTNLSIMSDNQNDQVIKLANNLLITIYNIRPYIFFNF